MSAVAEPAPHVPARHRRKHRLANFVQTYTYKLFFAHLGKFIIVAAYFVLLQTLKGQHTTILSWHVVLPDVKGTWDSLLSRSPSQGGLVRLMRQDAWDSMRHIVYRGVLEGVLGVVLYNQIGFAADKYREKRRAQIAAGKTPNRFLVRLFASPYQTHPVTPLQYVMLPVMLVVVTTFIGVPVYLGVHYGLAHAAHWSWLEPHISAHASIWTKIYGGDYDGLIVGFVVGLVAGRVYRAYLFANTMNYGRSWVAKGHRAHWWMPRATRELVEDLCAEGVERQQEELAARHSAVAWIIPLAGALTLAAAVLGYLVLQTNGFTS